MTLKEEDLKRQVSKWKERATEYKRVADGLDRQYKRVIDELRRQLKWWKNNAWKATFLSIINKFKRG